MHCHIIYEKFFQLLLLLLFSRSRLTLRRHILHFRVGCLLLSFFLGLLGLLLRFPLGFGLSALLGGGLLLCLQDSLAFGLELVLVALDDRTRNEADLVDLSNVDRLCGVFTFLV